MTSWAKSLVFVRTLLLVALLLGGAAGILPCKAFEDAPAESIARLKAANGVELHRGPKGRVERVVFINAVLNGQTAGLLRHVEGLRVLELRHAPVADAAWDELAKIETLRELHILDGIEDGDRLKALQAARPQLVVSYSWSAYLSESESALRVDLPTVSVIYHDVRPVVIEKPTLSCSLTGSRRTFGSVVIEPAATRYPKPPDPKRGWNATFYTLKDGAYYFVGPGRWYHVSSDGSTVTVSGQTYSLFGPRQTIVVDQTGKAHVPDYKLVWNPAEDRIEKTPTAKHAPDQPQQGTYKSEKLSSTDPTTAVVMQADISLGIMPAEGGELVDLSPTPLEFGRCWRGEKRIRDFPDTTKPPVYYTTRRGLPSGIDPKVFGAILYDAQHGVSILFDGPDFGTAIGIYSTGGIARDRDRNGRWHATFGQGPPTKAEKLQVICTADDGHLEFSLGKSPKQGDFRVRADGRQIIVGDRRVDLSPDRRTTITLAGDKAKGEKVRVLAVDQGKSSRSGRWPDIRR